MLSQIYAGKCVVGLSVPAGRLWLWNDRMCCCEPHIVIKRDNHSECVRLTSVSLIQLLRYGWKALCEWSVISYASSNYLAVNANAIHSNCIAFSSVGNLIADSAICVL